MRRIKRAGAIAAALGAVVGLGVGMVSAASSIQFTSIPLSQTELTTNWHPDRTTPSGGFASVDFADRHDVLEMRVDPLLISSAGSFYRTEGLQRLATGSAALSADLYVDPAWLEGAPVRAGLWGIGQSPTDGANWPIIEFTTVGAGGFTGWRVYDTFWGTWTNLPSVEYEVGEWNTLQIRLDTTAQMFRFSVDGDEVLSLPAYDTADFSGVILNNRNFDPTEGYGTPQSYDVHWSKFKLGVVGPPLPTSKDDCKHGGWQQYGFASQHDCKAAVHSDGHSDDHSDEGHSHD